MSNDMPTPRTDALVAARQDIVYSYCGDIRAWEQHARTLERELHAMTAERDAYRRERAQSHKGAKS